MRESVRKYVRVGAYMFGLAMLLGLVYVFVLPEYWGQAVSLTEQYPVLSKILLGLLVFLILRFGLRKTRHYRQRRRMNAGKRVGFYLNPTVTNVFVRIGFSLTAGQTIGRLIYTFGVYMESTLFPWWAAIGIGLALSLPFMRNDHMERLSGERGPPWINVPKAYVAILTFLGQRLPIYLEEGDHYWWAAKFGFGYSREPLPNSSATDYPMEQFGFVYIGDRPFSIWPDRKKPSEVVLKNVARDGSEVFNTFTVVIKTLNPLQWATSDDPILAIAERSRSALRTLVSFFSGIDNVMMKGVFSEMLAGHRLVTAFTTKPVDINPKGSVIQDESGGRIFEIVEPHENLEAEIEKVCDKIRDDGDGEMVTVIPHKNNGDPKVVSQRVRDHLVPVVQENGGYFKSASVSSVMLSDVVLEQANIAAGESHQRRGQELSARTVAEVRRILAEAAENTPESEMAFMAALAQDGHAKIIFVPGADRLTRAAIAGAAQIGAN